MADWTDNPDRVVPLFKEFDTPIDRWLRVVHDRHYYDYPVDTRAEHRAIITHSEVFGGPPPEPALDEERIAQDTLLETTSSF